MRPEAAQEVFVVAAPAADQQLVCPVTRQDIALVGVRNRPGGQLRHRRGEVLPGQARDQDGPQILLAKELTAR